MKLNIKISVALLLLQMLVVTAVSCGSRRSGSAATEGDNDSLPPEAVEAPDTVPPEAAAPVLETTDDALAFMRESGSWDRYSRGILPQMAEDVPEYAIRLLLNEHDGFVVVDKSRMKVIRFDKYGEEVASYGMACAKNYGTKHKRSDSRTPEGFFSVRKVHDSTEWHFVDDNGVKSEKKGEFGPRFIRLNIPGTSQIGIHGTCAPWSIGGRRSHGCIRIKNENILELVEMVDSGMPVIITPGRKDMAVNAEEGFEIPSISTVPGKPHLKLVAKVEKPAEIPADTLAAANDSVATPVDSVAIEEPYTDSLGVMPEETDTVATDKPETPPLREH